jgi:hypothetical protein
VSTASPSVRRGLVLTAELAERPARWHRLAVIPFGPADSQLGRELPPLHTSVPLMPRSFTVGADGSLWILDAVKHRVAHYSTTGAYLGDVRGLGFDRFHPQPRDLAFWDGRLYVLHQFHLAASFRAVVDDGFGPVLELASDGDALSMTNVFPGPEPMGIAEGVAALDRLGAGPHGIGRIALGDPSRFEPAAGLPVGSSTSVSLDAYREQSFHLVTTGPAERVLQPVRVRMMAGTGADRHRVPSVFSDHIQGGGGGALVLWLKGAPVRSRDAIRYGGGNWLLRYPADGSPLAFERLPEAAVEDAFQTRHLSLDGLGRIYLMLTERLGMAIYRR